MKTFKVRVEYCTQWNYEQMNIGNIKAERREDAEAIAVGTVMFIEHQRKDRYLKLVDVTSIEEAIE